MEPTDNRVITNLKLRVLICESEKKRLQSIIAYSQSSERRAQSIGDLAETLNEIRAAKDELAGLKAEE